MKQIYKFMDFEVKNSKIHITNYILTSNTKYSSVPNNRDVTIIFFAKKDRTTCSY